MDEFRWRHAVGAGTFRKVLGQDASKARQTSVARRVKQALQALESRRQRRRGRYITSSHHIETTDAGLDGLCIREI